MRFLPYAIGAFMLLPFALWAGFYVAFPGPKPVLDVPARQADSDNPGDAGKPGGATEKGDQEFSLRDLRNLIG